MAGASPIEVEYFQGIHLVDSILWFDAPRQADLCFVSHAHLSAIGPHRKLLLSEETAALLPRGLQGQQALVSPFYRRFTLGNLDLELFPSGHLLGSAQIRVTRQEARLVYTGDLLLNMARTAKPAPVLECDVLVLSATYGLPGQVFPPRRQVEQAIVGWVGQVLAAGDTPVFLAPALGKAQELCAILAEGGFDLLAPRAVTEVCARYRSLGIALPAVREFRADRVRSSSVVLWPPRERGAALPAGLARPKTAAVTGRALPPGAAAHLGVDAAFVISGHADHPALLRYVRESRAKTIYLVRGAASALAAELRGLGHRAWALAPPEQLGLF